VNPLKTKWILIFYNLMIILKL